jgi:hypothetical protein
MPSIEVLETEFDDPDFVALVSAFVSHYAELYAHTFVKVIHIDNWFGERWLGFAGKFQGIAGMRNLSLHMRLPAPPFRPSRVISCYDFDRTADKMYTRTKGDFSNIHAEKNGGDVWHLYRPGLYCWYSGNTRANTTASLMIYDVTSVGNKRVGYDAWYVMFDKNEEWGFTKCRNVSPEECIKIASACRREIAG